MTPEKHKKEVGIEYSRRFLDYFDDGTKLDPVFVEIQKWLRSALDRHSEIARKEVKEEVVKMLEGMIKSPHSTKEPEVDIVCATYNQALSDLQNRIENEI